MSTSISISPVRSPEDLAATILLFEAYAASLGIDLGFQNFGEELADMPGKYTSENGGALFLARRSDSAREAVGCIGLRSLSPEHGICEMKRLYVDRKGRGLGVGKQLADTVVQEARRLGYKAIVLDTLQFMAAARALYSSMGFVEVEPYYDSQLVDKTVFLRLNL